MRRSALGVFQNDELIARLRLELDQLQEVPVVVLMQRFGLLGGLIRHAVEEAMIGRITLSDEQVRAIESEAGQRVPPADAAALIRQAQLNLALRERYAERLEPFFLECREHLERVAYSVVRLNSVGIAEELYLRLIEEEESFESVAHRYSTGEEQHSGGRMPLIPVNQPHPHIQAALKRLSPGEIHPPIQVGEWVVLIRLDHRKPAELNETTSQQLRNELFNQEINKAIDQIEGVLIAQENVIGAGEREDQASLSAQEL
jgi:parvulin-like peptidyl-prolyl isomerase